MKLPNWEDAYVPEAKLLEYLLSETHPVGRWKARFLAAFGFDKTNVAVLEQNLLALAHDQEVIETIPSVYGTKYVIDGTLQTPTGNPLQVRTVWVIDTGQNRPRLVTAYPV